MSGIYDVIIIGAGPAGLAAGIYAARRSLKTLVIGKVLGGQTVMTPHIENYPGFKKIEGFELAKKMEEQVLDLGVKILYDEVTKIAPGGKNGKFLVEAGGKKHESKTVILAFGKTPRTLDVPGEKEFTSRGVSYCAVCDAPLFKGKAVAIVGGGNSAFDAARLLCGIARKVYLVHRRQQLRAFNHLIRKVKAKKNVELLFDTVVKKFSGDGFLRAATVENVKTGKTRELEIEGAIIEIGSVVKTGLIERLVRLDEYGHIVITNNCETFYPQARGKTHAGKIRPGVFAAGDITMTPYKQIVVAAGQGAIAALQAYHYIHGLEPHSFAADWGKKK
jgi:thioredoxin reductase (NADPH)